MSAAAAHSSASTPGTRADAAAADSTTFLYKSPSDSASSSAAASTSASALAIASIPAAGWACFHATASPAAAVFAAWLRSKLATGSPVHALYDPRAQQMMTPAQTLQRGEQGLLQGTQLFVVTADMKIAAGGDDDDDEAAAGSDAEEDEQDAEAVETRKVVTAAPAPTPLFSLRTPSGSHHPVLLGDLAPLVELRAYTRAIPLPLLWGMLQHVLTAPEASAAPAGPIEPGALVALVHALVQHVAAKTPADFPAALWQESARIHAAGKGGAAAAGAGAQELHVPSSVSVSLLRLYELCCMSGVSGGGGAGAGAGELDQESLIAALILLVKADSTLEQLHLAWTLFNEDGDEDEDAENEQEQDDDSASALAMAARESLSLPQFQRFLRATLLPSALALTKRASVDSVMGWIEATVDFVTSNLCSLFDLSASSSSGAAAEEPRISFLHLLQFQRSYPNILAFLTVNDAIQARMEKHISANGSGGGGAASSTGMRQGAAPTLRNARGPPLSAGTGATGGPLSPLHEASGEEDEDYASRSPLDSSSADDGRDLFTSDDGGAEQACSSAAEGSESPSDEAPVGDEPDSPLFSFSNSALPSVSMARSLSEQSQQSAASTQAEVQPTPAPSRSVSGIAPTAASSDLDQFTAAVLVDPSSGAVLALDPSHVDLLRRVFRPLEHLSVSTLLQHLQQYEEAPRGEIGAEGFARAVQEMMRERGAASFSGPALNQARSHLMQIHALFDVDHSGAADLIELCVGLCVLCGDSDVQSKLRFAFDLFDSDGDACLTRNEMMDLLTALLRPLLPNSERASHAFLQDLVASYVPALFEGARAFDIDASDASGASDDEAAAPRSSRRGDVISFREFLGMLAVFGRRVPFVAIIQRLLDPQAVLFGAGAGSAAPAATEAGKQSLQQQQQQQASASAAQQQRQRKRWDLSNRATVIIPRLAQSSDDDDAAQDSDDASFHGSLYSASPLSSYPGSPTLQAQEQAEPSDSCASDLEAYNASREKRAFQSAHRFPSYDEFRATGDASARPKAAAAGAGAQPWSGSLSSDDEEMSPEKEHRAYQAAMRLAYDAAQKAQGAQTSQSQFDAWKQGVDSRRAARAGQAVLAAAAAASKASKPATKPARKEAWSTSAPTHSSPSRPASKRLRVADSAAASAPSASASAALRDFHAASKDPSYRLGLFQLFKHQQQARAVMQQAAAGVQPSTRTATAMSARPATAPAPLSLAANDSGSEGGFAKWASAVTPRGSAEARRLQQERSTAGRDRPSTAAAASVTDAPPSSSPTFGAGRPTQPTRIALFTSAAASDAAAAAGLPVRLTFSVEDLTRLHALLKLLASLQPPGYAFLSPAAVVLKRLEPSLQQSASEGGAPIASADAFYSAMHFLLSSTPAGSQNPSGHLIDHLIACCFVGFQAEATGAQQQQAGGAMRIQDFLLAITAWCGSSSSGVGAGASAATKGKWAASFQMLLVEGRGRITRAQLAHLFECCVRLLLCVHDGLQDRLGSRGFSELVARVVDSSVSAFFPIADAGDRGSISYGDFTRVMSRYPTLVPWLQVMQDAQQRAGAGRQHQHAADDSQSTQPIEASSGDDSYVDYSSARSASASGSDDEQQAGVVPFADSAAPPILSVDLRPALSAEALEAFPQAVDGAVLAQAVSAEEALLQLSERDIYEFALARSLARDFDSQQLVDSVRAFPARSAGLTPPMFARLLLSHVFRGAGADLSAATSRWLSADFTHKLFLLLEQNGRVHPTDLILALHVLLPAGNDDNLRAAWDVLAAQSPSSTATSGCLTASQVERLLSSSLKLLLCFDPNAWGVSAASGELVAQPDIPLLITLLSRLATHNLFALANVRLDRSGGSTAAAGAAAVQLLSFDEFLRVFWAQPTLMPWLEVISGLVQGEEITQQQQQQQEEMQRQRSASASSSDDGSEEEAEYRSREAYERSRRAQGYASLSDAEEGSEYGSSDVASSSPSSPTLSSRESALLRAALASSSSASPPRAQSKSNGNSRRDDPRRALFNRWREQASPQKPAAVQAHKQQQQENDRAIRIQITPEPQQHLQRTARASASSNGRCSPLQAALNSRRSSASSSASSQSSDASLSTPSRRSGGQSGSKSKSKSKSKKIGPTTLSVDPFSVTLALHQNPSPRALLSAIKVKPLPVFTLPSHAPKLLLCIPLHSERSTSGSGAASKADGSSVTSPYGESAQSIKVYDADLPAFTFFKAHLRAIDGPELYRRCVAVARSAAFVDRENPGNSDALRVLHCRLTRLEFAAAFREILSGAGGDRAAAESSDSVAGLDGPLHSYAISLFRCLDHESRGSVLLMELALGLSLFLRGDHPSKLAFAMQMLDAEGTGVTESSLALFYRAIYSLLSALCSTHFRMSVPSRPPSPASAPQLRAGGPLSPSSLHSLPHEMMQERLQATARAQSSDMMRLAGLASPPAGAAAGASDRRLPCAEFLRISSANPHLLSFLHCIDLDETFSPRSKEARMDEMAAENRSRQTQMQEALNSAASPRGNRPQTAASPRAQTAQSWVARSPRSNGSGGNGAALGTLRLARASDLPALESVMKRSVRGLGASFYSPQQNRSFEEHVAVPDAHLIDDQTYFVIEMQTEGRSGSSSGGGESEIIACGGWSRRDKLFRGNDAAAGGIERLLVPGVDSARVRAMFVLPGYARRGLGKRILVACESAARAEGFTRAELMATLPGVPLYASQGYEAANPADPFFDVMLPDGVALPCVRMSKALTAQNGGAAGAAHNSNGSGSASVSATRAAAASLDLRSPSESEGEEIVVADTQGRAAAAAAAQQQQPQSRFFQQPMGSPTSFSNDLPSMMWSA